VPRVPVLAAAYSNDNGFRAGLQQLRLEHAVDVQSSTSVWPPGGSASFPGSRRQGRPPKLLRR
jgi:SRSO17 transposase